MPMKTQKMKLKDLNRNTETQCRAAMNEAVVAEYAAAMQAGDVFPPVRVFFSPPNQFWLGDGWHRVEAAGLCGLKEIEAEVVPGSLTDALRYAIGANAKHGLRRTHADIARAVEMAYEHRERLGLGDVPSARAIAEVVGVSNHCAGNHLGNIPTWSQAETRTGTDGKTYPVKPPLPPPPRWTPPEEREQEDEEQPPAPPQMPPRKDVPPRDSNGVLIPTHSRKVWERRQEVQDLLTGISRLRATLERAEAEKDPLYKACRVQGVVIDLGNAYRNLKTALPYAVCPYCQGTGCQNCKSLGMVSEFVWQTVCAQELKDALLAQVAK